MTSILTISASSENGDFLEIYGSNDKDFLTGGTGSDYFSGNSGDDTLIGGAGNDRIYGGKDTDTAEYSGSYSNFTITPIYNGHGVAVSGYEVRDWSGTEGSDTVDVEYLTFNNNRTKIALGYYGSIEVLYNNDPVITNSTYSSGVTSTNNILQGTSAVDTIDGGNGNQTLIGAGGNDTLYGGDGYDTAQYSGAFSDYTIKFLYNDINGNFAGFEVKDNIGTEGIDTLSSDIEYLSFNSGRSLYLYTYGYLSVKNRLPTGSVEVTGTAKAGQVLTASNSLEDVDGLGAITYQWQISPDYRTWSDFATGSTVTLTSSVIGSYIQVTASYTDMSGTKESPTSKFNERIEADINFISGTSGNDTLLGTLGDDIISGDAGDDLISGSKGNDKFFGHEGIDTVQYTGAFSNFSFKALYEGKNGAFSGYQVSDSTGTEGTDIVDVEYLSFSSGKSIYVLNNGSITPKNSSPTGTVEIGGTSKSGQVLTASHSLADSDGIGAITYQWQSSPDGIAWSDLTTGSKVTLSTAVIGLKLRVTASYTDDLGTKESISSAATNTIGLGTNIIYGTNDHDNLIGTSAIDLIAAGSGNDLISGSTGHDTIDGGAGIDTFSCSRPANNYQLTSTSTGWNLVDKTGADGTYTLIDVERLQFPDRTVILESKSHASYTALPVELYQFFITAFNAAPGVTYMDQLAEAYNYGLSVKQIVDIFTTKSQFTSVYAPTLSHQEMATKLIDNIVKNSISEAARVEGISDLTAALEYGLTVGDVIYNVFGNLAKPPSTNPEWTAKWGNTAKQFNNQITVAKYYTEILNQSTTDLETLRDVVQSVSSSTDVSSDAAIAQLIGVALMTGGLVA